MDPDRQPPISGAPLALIEQLERISLHAYGGKQQIISHEQEMKEKDTKIERTRTDGLDLLQVPGMVRSLGEDDHL